MHDRWLIYIVSKARYISKSRANHPPTPTIPSTNRLFKFSITEPSHPTWIMNSDWLMRLMMPPQSMLLIFASLFVFSIKWLYPRIDRRAWCSTWHRKRRHRTRAPRRNRPWGTRCTKTVGYYSCSCSGNSAGRLLRGTK